MLLLIGGQVLVEWNSRPARSIFSALTLINTSVQDVECPGTLPLPVQWDTVTLWRLSLPFLPALGT